MDKFLSIEKEEFAIKCYLEGDSLMKIANKLGRKSYGFLTKLFNKKGIPIRNKTQLNIRKGKLALDIDYFKSINTPEKAYWLGVLIADGSLLKYGGKCTLAVKDKELIQNFKNAIKSEHKLSEYDVYDKRTDKTYKRFSIQVTSKQFCQNLFNLGITPGKGTNCKLPCLPDELLSHCIRGIFDGDGCICFDKLNKICLDLIATEGILIDLKKYLINKFDFSDRKLSIKFEDNQGKIMVFHISKKQDQYNFLKWIYRETSEITRLSRKYKLYQTAILDLEAYLTRKDWAGNPTKEKQSKFYGVSKKYNKWSFSIAREGQKYQCSRLFFTEEEAAIAHDLKAIEIFRERAKTNFPINNYTDDFINFKIQAPIPYKRQY